MIKLLQVYHIIPGFWYSARKNAQEIPCSISSDLMEYENMHIRVTAAQLSVYFIEKFIMREMNVHH